MKPPPPPPLLRTLVHRRDILATLLPGSSSSTTTTTTNGTNLKQTKDDSRGFVRADFRHGTSISHSVDPNSTLVRPDMRVHVGSPHVAKFSKRLRHDDIVIVPQLFGPEDNWDNYYTLIDELCTVDVATNTTRKNPSESPTFNMVIDRLCEYFNIRKNWSRFNWYQDSEWKPFHHDSAAYNPSRANKQNITVGASFGACRELAFKRTSPFPDNSKDCRVYFPQTNNGVFSFGRDVNIHWKHGINALPKEEQDGKGRVSIIIWGLVDDVIEEDDSVA